MFQSENIRLRKLSVKDAELVNAWENDPDIAQTASIKIELYALEETERHIKNKLESHTSKAFIIEEKKTGKPIGTINLAFISTANRNAMLGISIGEKDSQGKGYGREAILLLLDYAFMELNLHRVYLGVFSFNERAKKLYERIGFQYEGTFREALYRNGGWHDNINMSMLKQEYINKYGK